MSLDQLPDARFELTIEQIKCTGADPKSLLAWVRRRIVSNIQRTHVTDVTEEQRVSDIATVWEFLEGYEHDNPELGKKITACRRDIFTAVGKHEVKKCVAAGIEVRSVKSYKSRIENAWELTVPGMHFPFSTQYFVRPTWYILATFAERTSRQQGIAQLNDIIYNRLSASERMQPLQNSKFLTVADIHVALEQLNNPQPFAPAESQRNPHRRREPTSETTYRPSYKRMMPELAQQPQPGTTVGEPLGVHSRTYHATRTTPSYTSTSTVSHLLFRPDLARKTTPGGFFSAPRDHRARADIPHRPASPVTAQIRPESPAQETLESLYLNSDDDGLGGHLRQTVDCQDSSALPTAALEDMSNPWPGTRAANTGSKRNLMSDGASVSTSETPKKRGHTVSRSGSLNLGHRQVESLADDDEGIDLLDRPLPSTPKPCGQEFNNANKGTPRDTGGSPPDSSQCRMNAGEDRFSCSELDGSGHVSVAAPKPAEPDPDLFYGKDRRLSDATISKMVSHMNLGECLLIDSLQVDQLPSTEPSHERVQAASKAPLIVLPFHDTIMQHWSLGIYRPSIKLITYYDSMIDLGVARRAEPAIRRVLSWILKESVEDVSWQIIVSESPSDSISHVPLCCILYASWNYGRLTDNLLQSICQQSNDVDCGVFLLEVLRTIVDCEPLPIAVDCQHLRQAWDDRLRRPDEVQHDSFIATMNLELSQPGTPTNDSLDPKMQEIHISHLQTLIDRILDLEKQLRPQQDRVRNARGEQTTSHTKTILQMNTCLYVQLSIRRDQRIQTSQKRLPLLPQPRDPALVALDFSHRMESAVEEVIRGEELALRDMEAQLVESRTVWQETLRCTAEEMEKEKTLLQGIKQWYEYLTKQRKILGR
ncbi:MAG: hypothetical protein LQ352_003176 [Teloschistes flavicans]|nr:MAG: hypothetical protein LQ352_003176 [Teloschistes flavicans]